MNRSIVLNEISVTRAALGNLSFQKIQVLGELESVIDFYPELDLSEVGKWDHYFP